MRRAVLCALALVGLSCAHPGAGWARATPDIVVVTPDSTYPGSGEYVYISELPEVVYRAPAVYPEKARRERIEGTVLVHALVGTDGRVQDTKVVKSIPGLDGAAVAALRQWQFKPVRSNGKPVAVWVAVPIRFSLHETPAAADPPGGRDPRVPASSGERRPVMAPAPPPVPETLHVARDEEPLDVAAFNVRLAAAGDSAWARWPVTIAVEFGGGGDCDCARLTVDVEMKGDDRATVTVTSDGLHDDSWSAYRQRIVMRRDGRTGWTLERAGASWACVGGRGHAEFGTKPCL